MWEAVELELLRFILAVGEVVVQDLTKTQGEMGKEVLMELIPSQQGGEQQEKASMANLDRHFFHKPKQVLANGIGNSDTFWEVLVVVLGEMVAMVLECIISSIPSQCITT